MRELSFLLTFMPLGCLAQVFNWTTLPDLPVPVSNNAVCSATYGDTTYVFSFAGIDSTRDRTGIHLDAYLYNVQDASWRALPSLPDTSGKIAAAAHSIGDTVYVVGGYHVRSDGSEASSDRIHRFSLACMCYLADGAPIPVPIDDQVQTVYRDSLLFVVTGWSNTGNVGLVQIYDPRTDSWQSGTSLPVNPNYPVFGAAGEILGDTIYYYGGAAGGSFAATKVLRKGYINPADPTDITWLPIQFLPEAAAYRPAAITYGSNVFWVGGSHISYNYDGLSYSSSSPVSPAMRILRYNSANGTSEDLAPQSYQVMDLRGAAMVGDAQWVIAGGMLDGPQVTDQVRLLSLDTVALGVQGIRSPSVSLLKTGDFFTFHSSELVSLDLYDQLLRHVQWMGSSNLFTWQLEVKGPFLLRYTNASGTSRWLRLVNN